MQLGLNEIFLHSLTVYDNKLWIIGGADYKEDEWITSDTIWSSENGLSWTEISTNGFTNILVPEVVIHDNRIWIMGGVSKDGRLKSEIYKTIAP